VAPGASLECEPLEVRERFGDCEAPRGRLEIVAEEGEGDLVAAPRLVAECGRRRLQALAVMREKLLRPPDRVVERVAMPGERQPGLEVDRRPERVEVVAQRVGPARGPQADRGRDPPEDVVGGDQHAVAEEHQLAVRVARRGDRLPALDLVTRVEQVGVGPVADEGPVARALLDQLVRHVRRDAVAPEPLHQHAAPVALPPDERTLLVVDAPL
jgi:hypothetical protein